MRIEKKKGMIDEKKEKKEEKKEEEEGRDKGIIVLDPERDETIFGSSGEKEGGKKMANHEIKNIENIVIIHIK